MKVLVTGAGGFIANALARRFGGRSGVELSQCGRRAPDGYALDLRDQVRLEGILAAVSPDIVIHAAGRTHGPPHAMLADNAVATAALTQAVSVAAADAGLILLGSAAQYGPSADHIPWREPDLRLSMDPYGLSKQAAEQCAFAAARRRGLKVTSLRLFNVVSAEPHGAQVFASFLRKAASVAATSKPPWRVPMGPLGSVRDFVDIEDALRVVEGVIDRAVWGHAINVCTGVGRPVRALVEATARRVNGEIVLEEAAASGQEVAWSVGDPARCEALLGFRPSCDLSDLEQRAAAWVTAAVEGEADA